MRWHILRTLFHKEVLRHSANRGGLVLVLLLVAASMLLSFFGHADASGGLTPGVQLCFIDYAQDSPLVTHLRHNIPADLAGQVRFRPLAHARTDAKGTLVYPQGTGAIQLRPDAGGTMRVWFWHPGDRGALAPFEIWFWQEAYRFAQVQRGRMDSPAETTLPVLKAEYSALENGLDPRSGLATALVLFGLFFVCVYLLPSLTCEERERGVLLAQALSPASPREILAAKFLFYPFLGLALAAVLAGTYRPVVLTRPFFWLALAAVVAGSMGIGLTIASVARTQRAASMGAMCYTLAVAVLLLICQQNHIGGLPYLALEYHGPRMLHAALTGTVLPYHWVHLAATGGLAAGWTTVAAILFRRRGWQ
jgi:hypothetical protein